MRTATTGVALAGMLSLLICACAADDEPAASPTSQVGKALEFCQDYYAIMCQQLWRCGCSEPALEVCEYQSLTCTRGFFAALEEGLAQGLVRYDAAAAERLLARVQSAPSACEPGSAVLGFDSYSALTFGGVFLGTLDAGEECGGADSKTQVGASFCREGHLCLPSVDGSNRCVAISQMGAPCPVVPANPGSSCLEHKPLDPDGSLTSAEAEVVCIPDQPGSETGRCARLAPDGNACSYSTQCESGLCLSSLSGTPGTCAPHLADGAECMDPGECASGRCDFRGEPPSCAPRSADGSDCLIDADCRNGGCRYEDESAELGRCGPREAKSPGPVGASCVDAAECESGWCEDGSCFAPICIEYAMHAER